MIDVIVVPSAILNIRNEVCHGLIEEAALNKALSERVLHLLLPLACIREDTTRSES